MRDIPAMVSRGALLAALYFAGAGMTVLYLQTPADVALFWPAAGIGYAMVLRFGKPYVLAIAAGQALLHLLLVPAPPLFLPFSIGSNALATWLAAAYVSAHARQLWLRTSDGFLLMRGAGVLCLASAGIGSLGMLVAGMIAAADWPRAFLQWALGDLLGATATTTSMLLLFGVPRQEQTRLAPALGSLRERLLWSLLMALLLAGGIAIAHRGSMYPLAIATLPLALLLWSAARFPPTFTSVATTVVTITLALILGLGIGLDGVRRPDSLQDTALLMSSLVVVSTIPILLAASYHERFVAMAALHQRATRDPLTDLLNRDAFEEHARLRLAANAGPLSLLYIDLDNFKLVNDSASHAAGDEMLRHAARLVQAEFAAGDALIAHSGGDEFTVLAALPDEQAVAAARRLLGAIEAMRVAWQGGNLRITASIGLAGSQPPHASFDELLSQVDAACHEAKDLGGNRVLATAENAESLRHRSRMMRSALDAREALDQRRLELWCQPIVPLAQPAQPNRVHFEVLLRWRDGEGLLRPPANLIAAAERFRLGPRLDRHVLDATLAWLESHPDVAARVAQCSINLGAATLVDEEFGEYLAARLRRSALRAGQLCLEITETSVVRDMTRTRRFVRRMRNLGCSFALDDFGTGFCSFSYLRDLQVDYLKIDGSFVRDLASSPLSEAVVRSITEIAHLLDIRAVAEHAEDETQIDLLRALDVDYAQGYAFQRPLPIAEFFGVKS